jgi:hypothetical protein
MFRVPHFAFRVWQLRDMHERLKEEFRKQGWPYPETSPAGLPISPQEEKV